ncbi:hypothetical protein U0070_017764, partial [Myodes glareolus]
HYGSARPNQQEIAGQDPLISECLELSVLYKEYAEDDNIYQQKIKDLHKKYSYIWKTRHEFDFSHLEALLDDSKELQQFKAVSAKRYLQQQSKFFEHFVKGGQIVKEFCQQEVEPMCKESDHMHIFTLALALSVSIQVEYMDHGEGGTTNPHVFP